MNKKERFDLLSELGCILCGRPAEIHHLKGLEFGCGMVLKANDHLTIPLCYDHHRGANGYHHLGKKTWEMKFEYQSVLLDETNSNIEIFKEVRDE